MSNRQLVDKFEQTIKINGKTITATIRICTFADDEDVKGSFDFGNEADNEAYLQRFYSGELTSVVIEVSASALNCEGRDLLGACHIKQSRFTKDVMETIEHYGMIKTACAELKREILATAERMKEVLA